MTAPHNPRNPGDLDLEFGDAGHPVFPVALGDGLSRLTADGKIITAGTLVISGIDELILTRHLASGTLDTSYGNQGTVRVALPAQYDVGRLRLLPLQDGSALVAGSVGQIPYTSTFAVHVLPDGSLDPSFGEFGYFLLYMSSATSLAAAAVRSDGKIALCVTGAGGRHLALLDNGHLDRSFGEEGTGLVPTGAGTVFGMATLPNGGFMLGGASGADAFVKQFLVDGSPDSGFGENGEVRLNTPGAAVVENLLVQQDGKIVVVGAADVGFSKHTLIARLEADGSMDSTFNGGEPKIMVFQGYDTYALSVAVQPDGKIVTGGASEGSGTTANVVLMRFLPNADMDTSFGINGQVMTDFGGTNVCNLVEIQDDGKILVSADTLVPSTYLLVRYIG